MYLGPHAQVVYGMWMISAAFSELSQSELRTGRKRPEGAVSKSNVQLKGLKHSAGGNGVRHGGKVEQTVTACGRNDTHCRIFALWEPAKVTCCALTLFSYEN